MDGKIGFIKFCRVFDVCDDDGADRILVEVKPEDRSVDLKKEAEQANSHTNNSKPKILYAFPLLPKAFRIKPKKGEGVFVLFASSEENTQRYYIGPVISQDNKLWNEPFEDAQAFMPGAYTELGENKRDDEKIHGVFPDDTEVSVRGRKNADIIISDDEVKIRSGVKVCGENEGSNYNIDYNHEDPAFIKVKYHPEMVDVYKEKDDDGREIREQVKSTVTVVADKINLFGNKSNDPGITPDHINGSEIIPDDKLNKLMDDAHQLPYGDKLIEILEEIIKALKLHTHPFPMINPLDYWFEEGTALNEKEEILLKQKKLLSDTVLIN